MKRKVITIIIIVVLLLTGPISLVCVGFCLPAQYGNTYYAVLPKMFANLKNTRGKKIIVVGNSGVAFALNAELVESELDGYAVCPFGLYGAVGTKAMMDLSRVNIGKGDIVVLAPEQVSQSLSVYFNAEYLWNAVDGDFGMLKYIENGGEMVGGFLGYAGRKYGYYVNNSAPAPTDVYAASSFNDKCTMIYDRPYNKLPLGYDAMSRVSFDTDIFSLDFAEYINKFADYVRSCGAELLFGFAPVNASGIAVGTDEGDIDEYYDYIDGILDCDILGDPHEYIFESDWFYDANVHVNSAGSVVYSRQLVADLKVYLGDSSPIGMELPEKPLPPDNGETGEDGKDAHLFTYEKNGSGWKITGLTDEGRRAASVEIPDFRDGAKVLSFDASVFAGNTVIEEIRIGRYVYGISDGSFDGCTGLKRLYVAPDAQPSECGVYFALLDGAPECMIYVPREKATLYINDYFWSRYGAYIVGY